MLSYLIQPIENTFVFSHYQLFSLSQPIILCMEEFRFKIILLQIKLDLALNKTKS